MQAIDLHDERHLNETRWGHAIGKWEEGDPEPLCGLIQAIDVPDFAREFLCALAKGEAKRPRGRPAARSPAEERQIVAEVFAEWERYGSKEEAIAMVAERRGMSEDTMRGIVERIKTQGWSLEAWVRWGRPTFKP